MSLIYKQTGWGYIGYTWPFGWQGSWPFATFELFDDKIILKLFPFKKVVELSNLDHVQIGHFLPVRTGLKMIHHGKGPDNLQFGCFKKDKLVETLKSKGIKVEQ